MPFSLLSGMIGAGVQAGSNARARRWQSEEAEKARQYNTEMMQMQQEYNTAERLAAQEFSLDMWNMNNEYNDPRNQLARATAAGINPNAVVQGMSPAESSPVTTSPQSSSAASTSPVGFPSQFDVGSSLANTASNYWQNQLLMKQAIGQDIDNAYKPSLNEAQIDKTVAECTKLGVDADKVRADIRALEALTPEQVKLVAAQVDEIRQKIRESISNVDKINAEKSNIEAETAFTQQQTDNSKKQGQILDKQIVQEDYSAYISELKKQLAENGILMDTDMLGRLVFSNGWTIIKREQNRKAHQEYVDYVDEVSEGYESGKYSEQQLIEAMDLEDQHTRNIEENNELAIEYADTLRKIMYNNVADYADALLGHIGQASKKQDIELSKEYADQAKSKIGIQFVDSFINWATTLFKDRPGKSADGRQLSLF